MDADETDVGVADCNSRARAFGAFGLVDGEDTHNSTARAGDYFVGEVTVGRDEDVAGKFTDWDHIGGFLQFENLLIDESAFFVHDEIRVHGTTLSFVAGDVRAIAGSGEGDTSEATRDGDGLGVAAIAAHYVHEGDFGGESGGTDDDTGNPHEFRDVGCIEVADGDHVGIRVKDELTLGEGARVVGAGKKHAPSAVFDGHLKLRARC